MSLRQIQSDNDLRGSQELGWSKQQAQNLGHMVAKFKNAWVQGLRGFLPFLLMFYEHILIIHNEFIVTSSCMDILYFYYIHIPFILSCCPLH